MNFITRNKDIRERAKQAIDGLDGLWEVVIRPYNKRRSNPQNDCFHGWCHLIGQTLGETTKEIKMRVKIRANMIERHTVNGQPYYIIRSSSDLDKQEFNELLAHTMVYADEKGIKLPQGGYDELPST